MVIDPMVFAYALLRVEDQHEQAITALAKPKTFLLRFLLRLHSLSYWQRVVSLTFGKGKNNLVL